jgi:ubiquitin-associated SH3 domain-containing protein
LILYATPEGKLADQCEQFFDLLRASGRSTTAQTYPPHVSLTGFFSRGKDAVERTIGDVDAALVTSTGGTVVVDELQETDEWVGLAISSDWFTEVAAIFAAQHRLAPGDDPVRLKDWLHLSLAYGDVPSGTSIGECAALARSIISTDAPTSWSVALWERRGLDWVRRV